MSASSRSGSIEDREEKMETELKAVAGTEQWQGELGGWCTNILKCHAWGLAVGVASIAAVDSNCRRNKCQENCGGERVDANQNRLRPNVQQAQMRGQKREEERREEEETEAAEEARNLLSPMHPSHRGWFHS
ncbi:hypothetical protein Mapa_017352 [Marchantia paleacea]|nr:hypothetical protein Mapa_017352 [Marchantia paleacea]